MKFLKVILFILLFISPSNANTIYNLIKIPNLEIYNNKSTNGIKYLRANKPFQVGVRNDNVTCFNSNIQTIDEKFKLIEENFNKYNSNFLKKINLKYVVLCENLSVSEIDAGGIPNHRMKTLIINIKFENGSIGTINYFANGSKAFPKERLDVFCGNKVLQLDNFRKLKGYGWPGFRKLNLWRQDKGQRACADAFISALSHGNVPPIPIDELFEVSEAIIEIADL